MRREKADADAALDRLCSGADSLSSPSWPAAVGPPGARDSRGIQEGVDPNGKSTSSSAGKITKAGQVHAQRPFWKTLHHTFNKLEKRSMATLKLTS